MADGATALFGEKSGKHRFASVTLAGVSKEPAAATHVDIQAKVGPFRLEERILSSLRVRRIRSGDRT
jgi:alanyl-tRNA synthetase